MDTDESVRLIVNGHPTKILPMQGQDHLHISLRKPKEGQMTYKYTFDGQLEHPDKTEGGIENTAEGGAKLDGQDNNVVHGPEVVEAPPFQSNIVINNQQKKSKVESDVLQLPDSLIPDVTKHIQRRHRIKIPSAEECKHLPKIDLHKFSSTWLSLSAKHVNLNQHLDFHRHISKSDYQEPTCNFDVPVDTVVDRLPGVQFRNELEYYPETGLKEVLQKLGDKMESTETSATRIALALAKNETSWVLTNLAALYWRVKGGANKALNCLRVALYSAPTYKDIALLSTANILHHSGYINDAIVATSYVLNLSPNLVVAHFNMANLFAAKEQWEHAAMFYESTLGLQSTFEPAKQRLKHIHCRNILDQHSLQW